MQGTSISIIEESSFVIGRQGTLTKDNSSEEDKWLRVRGWTQAQIDNMSPATRARELQAMPRGQTSSPVQSDNSTLPQKKDVGLKGLWFVPLILGFLLIDQWKKKHAANQAQREKTAEEEQGKAQKEAQSEQRARQERERREQQRRKQAAHDNKDRSRQWWEVLEVSRSATMEEVKRAYHSKLRMYHPDRVNGLGSEFIRMAEDRTRELNLAFDQAKRANV